MHQGSHREPQRQRGSLLDADHPSNGVLFPRLITAEMQAAILEALQRNVPHPNAVRLALARRREQRGEPPAVGVELPAHLQARDTRVQPHALETYDQLKDKHDASVDIPPAED
jgi:hypothetical protein